MQLESPAEAVSILCISVNNQNPLNVYDVRADLQDGLDFIVDQFLCSWTGSVIPSTMSHWPNLGEGASE